MIDELHWAHPGVSRMKAMVRSHFWWTNIDKAITVLAVVLEQTLQSFPCMHGTGTQKPWERVYVDFATYNCLYYLIMADAHCSWMEVIGPMTTTNLEAACNVLSSAFAKYNVPEQIVSNHGPPFGSADHQKFVNLCSVKVHSES